VGASADAQWRLNGEPVADALWRPRPGKWVLLLQNPAGRKLDEVSFEVRGGSN